VPNASNRLVVGQNTGFFCLLYLHFVFLYIDATPLERARCIGEFTVVNPFRLSVIEAREAH